MGGMDELEPCPCGGKFKEVTVPVTSLDPWTGKVGATDWSLPGPMQIRKCWMCGDEDLGENRDEVLRQVASMADKVRGMAGFEEIIRAGDEDPYVFSMYSCLRKTDLRELRLTREGDSVLARVTRRKDEISSQCKGIITLKKLSEDPDYMSVGRRLLVLLDHLSLNPDDLSAEGAAFQTLDQMELGVRRIVGNGDAP